MSDKKCQREGNDEEPDQGKGEVEVEMKTKDAAKPLEWRYEDMLALKEARARQREVWSKISSPHWPKFAGPHQGAELFLHLANCNVEEAMNSMARGAMEGAVAVLGVAEQFVKKARGCITILPSVLSPREFGELRSSLGTASGAQSEEFKRLRKLLYGKELDALVYGVHDGSVDTDGRSEDVHHALVRLDHQVEGFRLDHCDLVMMYLGADKKGTANTSGLEWLRKRVVRKWVVRQEDGEQ